MPDLTASLGFAAGFLLVLLVAEALYRRGWRSEATRKLTHVAGGILALGAPWAFTSVGPVLALALGFAAFLLVSARLGALRSVHGIGGWSVGAYVYPVGLAACFLVARSPSEYAVGVLVLALADTAAWAVGTRMRVHRYRVWGQPRSVEGSIAAMAVASAVCFAALLAHGGDPGPALGTALAVGLAAAVAEAAAPGGVDNVAAPLAAIAALRAEGAVLFVVWGGAAAVLAAGLAWQGNRRASRGEPVDGRRRLSV